MYKQSGWRLPRPARTSPGVMAGVVLALGLATSSAGAADGPYPRRTVTIVVPYTPGTSADFIARIFAERMSRSWKVPVVIDNRAGASGNIGGEYVARSAPDGYTMMFAATAFGTNPVVNKHTPYDPIRDFKPVGLAATSAMALVVSPKSKANTVDDFIAMARAQPGKLNYSSPGTGTAQHLAMELFKQSANIDVVHVPYKGTSGALTDVMGGQVDAMVTSLAAAAPFVQGKQLKMLAVMSNKRSPQFPDTSTVVEQGHPELVVDTWYGILAPANTPDPIVAKWNAEVNQMLADPDVIKALDSQGLIPAGGTPGDFGKLIAGELDRWGKVVAKAGITAD